MYNMYLCKLAINLVHLLYASFSILPVGVSAEGRNRTAAIVPDVRCMQPSDIGDEGVFGEIGVRLTLPRARPEFRRICDDALFDRRTVGVICRQLGFDYGLKYSVEESEDNNNLCCANNETVILIDCVCRSCQNGIFIGVGHQVHGIRNKIAGLRLAHRFREMLQSSCYWM